jgi:methyl-accepting chemotaxis protein
MLSTLKNFSIGTRLGFGFGIVTLIMLLLGIAGYYGAVMSERDVNELGIIRLPSVENLMLVSQCTQKVATAQRSLLNPDLNGEEYKRQFDNIAKARETYLAAMKVYEALPMVAEEEAVWKEFNPALERWRNANLEFAKFCAEREALKETYDRNAKSTNMPYRRAIGILSNSVNAADRALGKQRGEWKNLLLRGNDAAKYDKHYAAFEKEEQTVKAELKNALELTRQMGLDVKACEETTLKHAAMGVKLREALIKFDKSNPNAGLEVDRAVDGMFQPVFDEFARVEAIVRETDDKFNDVTDRMNRQSMTVCGEAMQKGVELLDKLVKINSDIGSETSQTAIARSTSQKAVITIAALVGVSLSVLCGIVLFVSITKPLRNTIVLMKDIAQGEGDLTKRLEIDSKDELGELAKWFNTFVGKLQHIIQDVAGNVTTLAGASTELAATATQLAGGAEETTNQSAQVAAAAEQLSTNMHGMSSSTDEMSGSIKVIASAIEELTSSIGEVAKSAERAAGVASNAAQLVNDSHSQIGELGSAADEIGKVIEVIQDIAEQTNLLALNATIEAARAGDAGKGFAVVATEVKELAKQTASATEDIRKRIEGIQGSTNSTVKSIGDISEVVKQVNELSRTIASAVEEQSITTKEIAKNVAHSSTAAQTVARNVTESATATQEITKNIAGVDQAAKQTAQGAAQTQTTGRELSHVAEQIQSAVGQFRV